MRVFSLLSFCDYSEMRALQLRLVELRAEDRIEDALFFLEHAPVITRGRGLQWSGQARSKHRPLPSFFPKGVSFSESERGGDLTYHGPGQLVVYPIFKLDGKGFAPYHDIIGFLRKLEQVFVEVLSEKGLCVFLKQGASGIWIKKPPSSEEASKETSQKIASIGIAVRKWVSYHGIALNVVNDLSAFKNFDPCGFPSEMMTRLSDWLPVDPMHWRSDLQKAILEKMLFL